MAGLGVVIFLGWKPAHAGHGYYSVLTRSDYVDLLLTLLTVFLGAIGLAVTMGALVIGLVALKTLREIKDEAATEAKGAAATKITETMESDLDPKVDKKVREILPLALQIVLLEDDNRAKIMTELVRTGSLDAAVERAMERISYGGPVRDPDDVVEEGDQD